LSLLVLFFCNSIDPISEWKPMTGTLKNQLKGIYIIRLS
jgi:hypothetical protein